MLHVFRTAALGLIAALVALPAVAADQVTPVHIARAGNAYAQLMADVSGGMRVAANTCTAICHYEDSAGAQFTGTSEQGCGEACVVAADKCDKQGQGDCAKLSCDTPDNCDTPQ
jgi:hypothetical protein